MGKGGGGGVIINRGLIFRKSFENGMESLLSDIRV